MAGTGYRALMTKHSGQSSKECPVVANVALAVGVAVILITGASQVGLLPGGDFFSVALFGLAGAVFSSYAVMKSRLLRSWLGILMSIVPIALLVYFLATSNG